MKPMLAKKWDEGIDPTGWYMSEKLDGIRATWDGVQFISRNEKVFETPYWFFEGLPTTSNKSDYGLLDGELWLGRGRFSETSGQVRRKTNQDWSGMKYMVFDVPVAGHTFEKRLRLLNSLRFNYAHIVVVEQIMCKSKEHLLDYELSILQKGGEGVMLHHPDSVYLPGTRSSKVLKVKRFSEDEAKIIGYIDGKGKYKGMVGALECLYKNNVIVVGTGLLDSERANPPKIGSTITFKYFEMSDVRYTPRFPVYKGVRDE